MPLKETKRVFTVLFMYRYMLFAFDVYRRLTPITTTSQQSMREGVSVQNKENSKQRRQSTSCTIRRKLGVWQFFPPTVWLPHIFLPQIVHHFGSSIMRIVHRYYASPACKRHPTDCPLKTTTERPPLGGGNRTCTHRIKKQAPYPYVPTMHVSLLPSRRRQSKWLGRRPQAIQTQQAAGPRVHICPTQPNLCGLMVSMDAQ